MPIVKDWSRDKQDGFKVKNGKERERETHEEQETEKDKHPFPARLIAAVCTVCVTVCLCENARLSVYLHVLETKNSMFTGTVCQTSLVNTADTVAA